jgi:DNA end-binding protein Ku
VGGLLNIPIKLDKATKEDKVSLHEYHKDDMGAGGRKRYCKSCNKELGEADVIKGLEVTKGQVVTFSKEELESLPLSSAKTIDVVFAEAKEINPLMLDTNYHIVPQDIGSKAFNLFMEGLKKTKKVAVGKVAIKQRENLCVIRPVNGGLDLTTMFWSDELKEVPQVPKAEVTPTELELMQVVITKNTKPFNHADYSDKYNDALLEMAQAKLSGKTITVAVQQQPQQNLEDALRALAGVKK